MLWIINIIYRTNTESIKFCDGNVLFTKKYDVGDEIPIYSLLCKNRKYS
jgi:hypothetical protein